MATTKIWAVKSRLDKVINYATNEEKIFNDHRYDELENLYYYATNDDKTEHQYFVTGINCTPAIALEEMKITKRNFDKEDKVIAYHAYQSFAKGEATPELAHKIGVQLAESIWGDKYEVIVSTHLNTECIHNHFVINSVSFVDGSKYHDCHESYALIRATSDELCKEYGLSSLEEKVCPKSKINYNNFLKSKYQNSDYYKTTKEDIDRAIGQAYSYKDFEIILKKLGYTLTYRANKLSVCREGYKRNIRIERAFGPEYSIDRIAERTLDENSVRVPFIEEYARKRYKANTNLNEYKEYMNKHRGGYQRMYLFYRYRIRTYKSRTYSKPLTEEQRKAIKQMDKYSEEARFLSRNKINSAQELSSYKELLKEELETLENERRTVNRNLKKCNYADELLRNQSEELSSKISFIKKEVQICKEIEVRIPKIKEELKDKDNNNEKESEVNERIK